MLTTVWRSVATQIFDVLNTLGSPRPPPMPAFNASIFASQLKVRPSAFWLARPANQISEYPQRVWMPSTLSKARI